MNIDLWENINSYLEKPFTSSECSLGFLVLTLHQQKSNFILHLQTGLHSTELCIHRGKVVGGRNIPRALESLSIQDFPNESLEDLVSRAMTSGHTPNDIFKNIALGTGAYLVAANNVQDAHFELKPFKAPEVSIPIEGSILNIFLNGLVNSVTDSQIELKMNRQLRARVKPLHTMLGNIRLAPQLLGLIRNISDGERLASALKTSEYSDRWRILNQLMELGLLEMMAPSSGRKERRETKAEKKVKQELLDSLNNYGNDPDLIPSYKILNLELPGDINIETISERYRKLSAKYHPDRFNSLSDAHQTKAQVIFSRIATAYSELEEQDSYDDLKARLDAESRGEKYVTESDTKEGELLYAQAKHAFRRKADEDALQYVTQGLEADPYNWRLIYINLQIQVRMNKIERIEAANQIVHLEGPRSHEKIESLYVAAEYFFHGGDTDQAYSLFRTIVEKSPEHIGARRYLRLKQMRESSTKVEEEKKGFWGGILSRRKK